MRHAAAQPYLDEGAHDGGDARVLGLPVWLWVAVAGGLLVWLGLTVQRKRQLAQDPTVP